MDQDRFDAITLAEAEYGAGPTVTRRLFSGGVAAQLLAFSLHSAATDDEAAAESCR
jgi:hypothetical protein